MNKTLDYLQTCVRWWWLVSKCCYTKPITLNKNLSWNRRVSSFYPLHSLFSFLYFKTKHPRYLILGCVCVCVVEVLLVLQMDCYVKGNWEMVSIMDTCHLKEPASTQMGKKEKTVQLICFLIHLTHCNWIFTWSPPRKKTHQRKSRQEITIEFKIPITSSIRENCSRHKGTWQWTQ